MNFLKSSAFHRNLVKSLRCCNIMAYFINVGISELLEEALVIIESCSLYYIFSAGHVTFLRIILLKPESFWPKNPSGSPKIQETGRTKLLT